MLKSTGVDNNEFLEYKGRPLVRKDDEIIYGDLSDKYHVFMMIMAEAPTSKGIEVPSMIMVQLMPREGKTPEKQIISKSLSDALDTADIWLDRYNK